MINLHHLIMQESFFLHISGQCWDKFKHDPVSCNVAYKALSLHVDRLLQSSSMRSVSSIIFKGLHLNLQHLSSASQINQIVLNLGFPNLWSAS